LVEKYAAEWKKPVMEKSGYVMLLDKELSELKNPTWKFFINHGIV